MRPENGKMAVKFMNIHYLKKIDAYIHVRVRAVKPKTKFKIFGDGKYS